MEEQQRLPDTEHRSHLDTEDPLDTDLRAGNSLQNQNLERVEPMEDRGLLPTMEIQRQLLLHCHLLLLGGTGDIPVLELKHPHLYCQRGDRVERTVLTVELADIRGRETTLIAL